MKDPTFGNRAFIRFAVRDYVISQICFSALFFFFPLCWSGKWERYGMTFEIENWNTDRLFRHLLTLLSPSNDNQICME